MTLVVEQLWKEGGEGHCLKFAYIYASEPPLSDLWSMPPSIIYCSYASYLDPFLYISLYWPLLSSVSSSKMDLNGIFARPYRWNYVDVGLNFCANCPIRAKSTLNINYPIIVWSYPMYWMAKGLFRIVIQILVKLLYQMAKRAVQVGHGFPTYMIF